MDKDDSLLAIADQLMEGGYYKEAGHILEHEIRQPSLYQAYLWVDHLAVLGVALTKQGQHRDADHVLAKATEIARSLQDYPQHDHQPGLASDNPALPLRTGALKFVAAALWDVGRSDDAMLVLESIPDSRRRQAALDDVQGNESKWRSIFLHAEQPDLKSDGVVGIPATERALNTARTVADQLDEGRIQIESMKSVKRRFNLPVPETDLAIATDPPEQRPADLPSWLKPKPTVPPSIAQVMRSVQLTVGYTVSEFIGGIPVWTSVFEAVEPGSSRSILCQICRIAGWLSPGWAALYTELPCGPR